MLGAICGDIIGSTFERSLWTGFGESAVCDRYDVPPRFVSRVGERIDNFTLFHPNSAPTDDSIETVAMMEWLLHGGDFAQLLRRYFRRYPEAGFGSKFAEWASSDTNEPCGSFGNGAAMRVSPIAVVASSEQEVLDRARISASATHMVPEAIAGAQAIALSIFWARKKVSKAEISLKISAQFGYDLKIPLDAIRQNYRFSSRCPETVPYAIRAFLESNSFEETIRRAISIGGDSDTIACMSGGIAEAYWGLPPRFAESAKDFLDDSLRHTVEEFESIFGLGS